MAIPPLSPRTSYTPPVTVDNLDTILDETFDQFTLEDCLGKIDSIGIKPEEFQKILNNPIPTMHKLLELCTRFFQDLLKQPNEKLPEWLEQQSKNLYKDYEVDLYPFSNSFLIKKQMDELKSNPMNLDSSILARWNITYTAATSKLKMLKLDKYITDAPAPPEDVIDEITECITTFLDLAKNLPEEKEAASCWLDSLNEHQQQIIFGMSVLPLQPFSQKIPNFEEGDRAYNEFKQKLNKMGLDSKLLQFQLTALKLITNTFKEHLSPKSLS